jgi:hypothetical protein
MQKPKAEPKINVMIKIGKSEKGSFQPIGIMQGSRIRKESMIPLTAPLTLIFVFAIKNPATIQKENADKLASQVNFCIIIGTTSVIPAKNPKQNSQPDFFHTISILI